MAHRLTPRRLAALRAAAAHPMGNISLRIEIAPGVKAWLTAAGEIALEELGLGDSIDDCGHVQGSADPTANTARTRTSSASPPRAVRPSPTPPDATGPPGPQCAPRPPGCSLVTNATLDGADRCAPDLEAGPPGGSVQ
ncbi:hypothetical protein ACFO9E_13050 [Streptomyces maoxianensis]|uniref:Uncharacterized protein n=1 Tax=Streptomyces maoxianensis TaxID=1459942 RepID=A0ABV9G340_9ACTN